MKKALIRSLGLIILVGVSLLVGLLASGIWEKIERNMYPLEYSDFVDNSSREFGVPKKIIYAVIKTESNFESNAISSDEAIGLMQLIPSTFEEITEKLGDHYEKGMMYDPETNIRYGAYYLSYLYRHFADWDVVFAAYNAGMGTVSEWLEDPAIVDSDGKLVNIPYDETQKYVKKVNSAINKYVDLYGEDF